MKSFHFIFEHRKKISKNLPTEQFTSGLQVQTTQSKKKKTKTKFIVNAYSNNNRYNNNEVTTIVDMIEWHMDKAEIYPFAIQSFKLIELSTAAFAFCNSDNSF